ARLSALVAGIPGMSGVLAQAGGTPGTVVIDLSRGAAAREVTPETLPAALEEAGNWTALSPAEDIAGLGQRPDYAQIYLLRDASGAISLALLPIAGSGYGGRIEAILALRGDM